MLRGRRLLACVLALAGLAAGDGARAQRSEFELYDPAAGLDAGEIVALAQDRDGFLWIGSHAGLLRYDGRRFVAWAPDTVDELVWELATSPAGEVVARTRRGRGFVVTASGVVPLRGPDGAPLADLDGLVYDRAGALWCIVAGSVWRRSGARWERVAPDEIGAETPVRLSALVDGVGLVTSASAWVLRADAPARRVLVAPDLWAMAGGGAQPLWIASHYGTGLWRVDDTAAQPQPRPRGRTLDLKFRGDTLWLALDRYLVAYERDGRVRTHDTQHGLPSGGPLLVDREGSLWLGTFTGLAHFAEPDTWRWDESDGLPSQHAYWIARAGADTWVTTWAGLARYDAHGTLAAAPTDVGHWPVCADAQGNAWTAHASALQRWDGARFVALPQREVTGELRSCARDGEALWLLTAQSLFRIDGAGVQRVDANADDDSVLWRDAAAQLWRAHDGRACRYAADGRTRQDCVALPPAGDLRRAVDVGAGRVWIGARDGVLEFDGVNAHLLPASRRLDSRPVNGVQPAQEAGVWVAGPRLLARVEPCSGCADGWRVLETPRRWQGLPPSSAVAALETPQHDLWIAGNRGVFRIPAAARGGPTDPPHVVAASVRVDDVVQALDAPLRIAPGARNVRLEFAALSFRDRGLLRYRSRLAATEAWTPAPDVVLGFLDLPAGNYRAELEASLDGEHWSEPAALAFEVLPVWYRRTWAYALFALAALALLALAYRLRVASLLRVERERTRIAMDLHDDFGAGLGAIGMLAGVAARDDVDAGERRRVVHAIADAAGVLGGGLRSLVWAMRTPQATLADFAAQLADHARRLVPGPRPELHLTLPPAHPTPALRSDVARHALPIALEALHNAARHSAAGRVDVELVRTRTGFVLSVRDDGVGFDAAAEASGAGLHSMRRRAALIGAALQVTSGPGQGSCVRLEVVDGAPPRMSMRWLRRRRRARLGA